MKKFLLLFSISIALLAGIRTSVHGFDPSGFPLNTFKNFQRHEGLPEKNIAQFDAAVHPFSAAVTYTGNHRKIGESKSRFIGNFSKIINQPALLEMYENEIEVIEQVRSYWIPVQKDVIPYFAKELQIGDIFTIYVRYIGGTQGESERVYLMIEFTSKPYGPPNRQDCYANELNGVKLGDPIDLVKKKLTARYGKPVATIMQGQSKLVVFIIDQEFKTQLIIGDAGAGYRKKVFSVQIAGPPNPNLIVHNRLRLGASPQGLVIKLGEPISQKQSGKGFTRWVYKNSNCSVELKNGVLASMLIADDPHYFSE